MEVGLEDEVEPELSDDDNVEGSREAKVLNRAGGRTDVFLEDENKVDTEYGVKVDTGVLIMGEVRAEDDIMGEAGAAVHIMAEAGTAVDIDGRVGVKDWQNRFLSGPHSDCPGFNPHTTLAPVIF